MSRESGFSLQATPDSFPAGLRVLVVDDDPTWLRILEKMLKKCLYEVTTCGLAREALKLLRERKGGCDIVISDVNMPDMDGFKLLEHVGLEMDLPVIMMSVDGETKRVMKGIQHGACDYLLKPIRMKELKNIWQHVLRKRMHEVKYIDSVEDFQLLRSMAEISDSEHLTTGGDHIFARKRKDVDNNDPSCAKRPRVVWSVDLHQKFVKAVNHMGVDRAGPKKILDLMEVPWLTRDNVASHLQKVSILHSSDLSSTSLEPRVSSVTTSLSLGTGDHKYRLYLSRLQKGNELKNSKGGLKSSDQPKKEAEQPFCILNDNLDGNSTYPDHKSPVQTEQPFCILNDNLDGNSTYPDHKPPVQTADNLIQHKTGHEDLNLQQLTEPMRPFSTETSVVCSAPSSSQIGSFDYWNSKSQDPSFRYGCFSHEHQRNMLSGMAPESRSSPDDFSNWWLQGDNFGTTSAVFDNTGFSEYIFPNLMSQTPPICLHEIPRLGLEHLFDPVEYAFADQSLFIT